MPLHNEPAHPARKLIKPHVDHILNAACAHAGNPTHKEPLNEKWSLEDDLLIGPTTKAVLAVPYTSVAIRYKGGRPVAIADAASCDTVKDAVDLVHRRANGK